MVYPNPEIGIVKQVLSGDTIIVRRNITTIPSPERLLILCGVVAPKLARQRLPNSDTETKDEPYAFEAREYLRKMLIGKEVGFISENKLTDREYAKVWAGKDPNKDTNVIISLLQEGLVKIRDGARNRDNYKDLFEIEAKAKQRRKGLWGNNAQAHVRNIKWQVDDQNLFMAHYALKPINAIVEYVRDATTFRLLLSGNQYVTLILAGVRRPQDPLANEAKLFIERQVLQRDVKVILEQANNSNFIGSMFLADKNIGEIILSNGYGKCVEWAIKTGLSDLRRAETKARDARAGVWSDYVSNASEIPANEKDLSGTVLEVIGGDTLVIKTNAGAIKRISLSSIRSPRERTAIAGAADGPAANATTTASAAAGTSVKGRLYEVPWLFEAREFLRKKLVGRKATITIDYKQPATDKFPEKINCTIQLGGMYVAEAMVAKGFATVLRHRNDDYQRSSRYDKLVEAEQKAVKLGVGVHSKKEHPPNRIQDLSGNPVNSKKFFSSYRRIQSLEAVVEYVASASRLKLFIPKDSVIVNFILAGIVTPKTNFQGASDAATSAQNRNPLADQALEFTKQLCLQHDVSISVVDIDKAGVYIGWLFVGNVNVSVALLQNGFGNIHGSAQSSEFAQQLKQAVDDAYRKRIGIWENSAQNEPAPKEQPTVQERQINYEAVVIPFVKRDTGSFYTHKVESSSKLITLGQNMCQEFLKNPPVPGSCWPSKGKVCGAKFSGDGKWYRARVEKIEGNVVSVFYIDYGNSEVLEYNQLAELPEEFLVDPPYATEHVLACFRYPPDPDEFNETVRIFAQDTYRRKLLMNVEIQGNPSTVIIYDPSIKHDIGKSLIADGLALVKDPRDRRLSALYADYRASQDIARIARFNIWRHGDVTEDEAHEFGSRR